MEEIWLGLVAPRILSSPVTILANSLIYWHQSPVRVFHQQSGIQPWRHKEHETRSSSSGGQFQDWAQRTAECQAPDWVWEHGCGIVVRGMQESVWVLVLGDMLCYHIRNLTTASNKLRGKDGSGDSYWNLISSVWLFFLIDFFWGKFIDAMFFHTILAFLKSQLRMKI